MIKVSGDLNRLSKIINSLPLLVEMTAKKMVDTRRERIINEVDFQNLPLATLSPSTINRKGHDLILRDSNEMLENISYEMQALSAKVTLFANDAVQKMIYSIEGSSNRPSRDVWSLSDEEVEVNIPKVVRNFMQVINA